MSDVPEELVGRDDVVVRSGRFEPPLGADTVLPRAVGVRSHYREIPADIRAWVESTLRSPVTSVVSQLGGMSPGCAVRVHTLKGYTVFVKAVGSQLNPDTPGLFRKEIDVLWRLPHVQYRPALLASYDDDDWVAIMLEDVDGRTPDLTDPDDADTVWAMVRRQVQDLTPAPAGLKLPTLGDTANRWLRRWEDIRAEPGRFLPGWAVSRVEELYTRVSSLPDRLPVESLCHWDIRDDNLLIRADGSAVILDWGMARLGPHWADLFFLALSWAASEEFDMRLAGVEAGTDEVTDLLVHFAAAQSWRARQLAPPGLPNLPEFCRVEADRMFAGAERRLRAAG